MQTVRLELSKGYYCLIDEGDLERVSAYNWFVIVSRNHVYASTNMWANGKRRTVKLHRWLMGCTWEDTKLVDHIDGDTLNNTKSNLRIVSKQQNNTNSKVRKDSRSGFKGVFVTRREDRWEARIRINGRQVYLGTFDSPQLAALCYDENATHLWGEHAKTNKMLGLI